MFIDFQMRLFVTNQIQYLKHADDVIVMDNNRISERGTYDELIQHNGAFAEFLRTHLKELEVDDEEGVCARNSSAFLASLSDYRLAIARCVPVPVYMYLSSTLPAAAPR